MEDALGLLPLYRVALNPDDPEEGVDQIALVDAGAIESDWVRLRSALPNPAVIQRIEFKRSSKQILVGAALIPDKKVVQRDDDGGLYQLLWTQQEVTQAFERWMADPAKRTALNIMHSTTPVKAQVTQSWLTRPNDMASAVGLDLPPGSWAIAVHVEDKDFWDNYVETGVLNGFSIEGMLTRQQMAKQRKPMEDKTKPSDNTSLIHAALKQYAAAIESDTQVGVKFKGAETFIEEALDSLYLQRVLNKLKKMGKNRTEEMAELYNRLRAEDGFEYFRQKRDKIMKQVEQTEVTQAADPIVRAIEIGKAQAKNLLSLIS